MNVAYRIKTEQTAEFPVDFLMQAPEPGDQLSGRSLPDAITGFVGPSVKVFGLDHAINIPDGYPQIGNIVSRLTGNRLVGFLSLQDNPAGSLNDAPLAKISARTANTRPGASMSILSPPDNSATSAVVGMILTVGISSALVRKEADEWLTTARNAALNGDMRAAYRGVLRGFDVLLRHANWNAVSEQLDEICSEKYPAEFGIGAMRFSSDAAGRIPKWNAILLKLRNVAQQQKIDVRDAMRGLAEVDGAT